MQTSSLVHTHCLCSASRATSFSDIGSWRRPWRRANERPPGATASRRSGDARDLREWPRVVRARPATDAPHAGVRSISLRFLPVRPNHRCRRTVLQSVHAPYFQLLKRTGASTARWTRSKNRGPHLGDLASHRVRLVVYDHTSRRLVHTQGRFAMSGKIMAVQG